MGNLPAIVIAGFQKCGTSALQSVLVQCPGISGPTRDPDEPGYFRKEVQFFNNDARYRRGVEWYRSRFPDFDTQGLDATPEYVTSPRYIERMAATLPEARIILLIRDPVDRAFSAWNHWRQEPQWDMFRPEKGFEANIKHELKLRKRGEIHESGMLHRGFYISHIEILDRYYPRDQVYLGYSEDLLRNHDEELARLLEFLGIDEHPAPQIRSNTRAYDDLLSDETRRLLRKIYRPFDEQLEARVGAPPPWLNDGAARVGP